MKLVSKEVKREKLKGLKGIVKKFAEFLGRRHIWSGLLAGFIWTFPVPFILTAFLASFRDFPEETMWILFFPFELSFLLTDWMMKSEVVDPVSWTFILWIMAIFIGMSLGVGFTYSVHRIRVWRRKTQGANN